MTNYAKTEFSSTIIFGSNMKLKNLFIKIIYLDYDCECVSWETLLLSVVDFAVDNLEDFPEPPLKIFGDFSSSLLNYVWLIAKKGMMLNLIPSESFFFNVGLYIESVTFFFVYTGVDDIEAFYSFSSSIII